MLKKTITYEDFNGETVSEDHFFHLSKADLVELELSRPGGMAEWLQNIVKSEDGKAIIEEFKKLLLMSYGKKSDDGKRFIRNQALTDDFVSSEAYSTLFMELVTDAGAAAEFVNGVVPKGLSQDIPKLVTETEIKEITKPTRKTITRGQAIQMTSDELNSLIASGTQIVD